MSVDFQSLAADLLQHAEAICEELFPEGRRIGKDWRIGDIAGSPGNSLGINLETGKWGDFASGDRGGDLISLYAAAREMDNGEAARELRERYLREETPPPLPKPRKWQRKAVPREPVRQLTGAIPGEPGDQRWCYTDRHGNPLTWIVRKDDVAGGRKKIVQYTPGSDGSWVAKGLRGDGLPLYNLKELYDNLDAKVVIVEGEKCAEAARSVFGSKAVVTTWLGGSSRWTKADWSPLAKRKVYIWPDSDPERDGKRAGEMAARGIARHLVSLSCDVSLIDVSGAPERDNRSWDIADAVESGWTRSEVINWVLDNAKAVNESIEKVSANLDTEKTAELAQINLPDPNELGTSIAYAQLWDDLGLQLNSKKIPIVNDSNVRDVIETMRLAECWYDSNACKPYMIVKGDDHPTPIERYGNVQRLVRPIQRGCGLTTARSGVIYEALLQMAQDRKIDPPKDDWYDKVTWDGVERIETFLIRTVHCEDNEYTRAVSANLWKMLAARIREPGCQVDNMVILEGAQGIKKTTALRNMVPHQYFTSPNMTRFDAEEYLMRIQGHLISEMGELHGYRHTDIEHMKQFITETHDNYRAKYAAHAARRPRRCIFIGTTNHTMDYLMDATGARRFWPVRCGDVEIDIDYVKDNRDQMLAEAKHRIETLGEPWWIVPEMAAEEQEVRAYQDPWRPIIEQYMSSVGSATAEEVLHHGLKLDYVNIDMKKKMRMGAVLAKMGYKKKRERRGSQHYWVWYISEVMF